VVPDTRTNSLLITTNAHFFPQVIKVIDALDVPTPQVLIEAKIVEISRDDRERLGVRWSPDGSTFTGEDLDDSALLSTQTTFKEVFAGSALDTALRTGILNARTDLDILIQFLVKNTSTRVRAEPRINVADNETGRLFVGARVPFITFSTATAEGGRNDAFQYQDVGIILQVAPHINRDGEVALKISVESSQIRQGETLFGGAIIDTRNYRTDLLVKSGQTLVLGGIIQREESEIERKLFILGDIPLLGWLFKKKDTVARDVELMVFLRPRVTRSLEDVEKLMKDEAERTPQIQKWEKDLEREARERKEREKGE
jgi:general secretion pathway protein D